MNIKAVLSETHLNSDNAIVIGSGILNALELRKSNDLEIIVPQDRYNTLLSNASFVQKERHGRTSLEQGLLNVGTTWTIVGHTWTFETLLDHSVVLDGVRYITVEFLCNAKTSWLLNGEFRQKDRDDIVLMNAYLDKQDSPKCGCDC